jgi:5-methylcytosine-specific restriction protein B
LSLALEDALFFHLYGICREDTDYILDTFPARIGDPDFQIGPSYLMKRSVYRDGGLERTWRTKILPLLEEHHYGEGVDVGKLYGLPSLRSSIAPAKP